MPPNLETFPGLDNSFARELSELSIAVQPDGAPQPTLTVLNTSLAAELGADPAAISTAAGVAILAGNAIPEESTPIAMAYAGHQFGQYSPILGDGRALLLGETTDSQGNRYDISLKGSGRTPFARGGDGKALMGPMLREYLISEAMHSLNIPTTRALAVVATGEEVRRERYEQGAILTRVAASHLRVGTFEYAGRLPDRTVIRKLADYAIKRHYPQAQDAKNPYLALLELVIAAQAHLVAQWLLAGFIHGVMNTDNMAISGEGIDYGPCAFLDTYDSGAVFSSIDRQGRYAFGNQPGIALWNLTRFAETLLRLIDEDTTVAAEVATETLGTFVPQFRENWTARMRSKLGLVTPTHDDHELFTDYLELIQANGIDYSTSFRTLSQSVVDDSQFRSLFTDPASPSDWLVRWQTRIDTAARDPQVVSAQMDAVNPLYIPRNHLVEEALAAAETGDLEPFNQLLAVVTEPFVERTDQQEFAQPAPPEFTETFQTFCGT